MSDLASTRKLFDQNTLFQSFNHRQFLSLYSFVTPQDLD